MSIHEQIVKEINKEIARFSLDSYLLNKEKYERELVKINISIEEKRARLMNILHEMIIKTFSVYPKIHDKKKVLPGLKSNSDLIRSFIAKLRDVNYYLHTTLLEDIGMKRFTKNDFSMERIKKEMKRMEMKHEDMVRLQHRTEKLMEEIVSFDKSLVRTYSRGKNTLKKEEGRKIQDIEKMLQRESELLCHLEAKIPPPSKISLKLLAPEMYTHWASRILALLVEIENTSKNIEERFRELKKKEQARKQLTIKISQIIKEKNQVVKLKDKHGWRENEWHALIHHFGAAARL